MGRGKKFTIFQDVQICLSWLHAKHQEMLGDHATDEIRSSPFNVWDTVYEHAVYNDAGFEERTVYGLRTRFLVIQRAVLKFSESVSAAKTDKVEASKVIACAMKHYREACNEDFKFLRCYVILRKHSKFSDLVEIDSSVGYASNETMPDLFDDTDVEGAYKSNQRQRNRGKNFTSEHDKQICLSWVHAKHEAESSINAYRLAHFSFWDALHKDAVSKNPDLEVRTVNGLRLRCGQIRCKVRAFSTYYNSAIQQGNDHDKAITYAMQQYQQNRKEDFKHLECFEILFDYLDTHSTSQVYSNTVNVFPTEAEDTKLSGDEQESWNMFEGSPKLESHSSEVSQAEPEEVHSEEDEIPAMIQETSDSEQRPPLSQSGRGKNFTTYHDKLLCQSWIKARETESTSGANSSNMWKNVYAHAISLDRNFKVRTLDGLRQRLGNIKRSVRRFSECYKMFAPEDKGEPDHGVIQRALKLYKDNHGDSFKFKECWLILRQCPEFCENKELSTPKLEVYKPSQSEEHISNQEPQRVNVRQDEIQSLLKASIDVGIAEARFRGERIEPMIYDVQQQMAAYGVFKERKLYMIKKMYDRTEREYKNNRLRPYPPEARILWGTRSNSEEEKANDEQWDLLIQHVLDTKKGTSFLSGAEIRELIKQAIDRRVEYVPPVERKIIFNRILRDMHSNKLCCRKTADQLLHDYLRMKKHFQEGSRKHLPPEAALLWEFDGNDDELTATEPIEQIDFPECELKLEMDLCRICQAEQPDQTKDLFFDEYNGKTYAAIIYDTIKVEMINDGKQTNLICDSCSTYIESLASFVQQCRNSCINQEIEESNTMTKIAKLEFEIPDTTIEFLNDEVSNLPENDCNGFDDNSVTNEDTMDVADEVCVEEPAQAKIDIANDQTKPTVEVETRKKLNYRKYVESRSRKLWRNKPQCHLCGIRVLDLPSHIESHSGKGFQCQVCDRVCPNRRQLRVHMNRHTKKYKFPCRYCDKMFFVWSSRACHEKNHHENQSNKCDVCGVEYRNRSYLLQHHKFVHLGIRNLKCSKCDFSTSIKTRLLNHFRSLHTSERPYKCSVCDFLSNSNTGYYIHFKRHKKSGEATSYTIKCAYCEELFTKDASLEVHIVKKHPDRAVVI